MEMRTFADRSKFKINERRIWKVADDIAKYITIAVILSSMFGSIEDAWVMYTLGILAVAASLLGGLWLQRKPKQKDHYVMGAIVMFSFVIAISIVGVTYFTIQDRKEEKRKMTQH